MSSGCDRPADATRANAGSTTRPAVDTETEPVIAAANASPIRLEPPAIDFGPIQKGSTAEATVRLINTSDQTLQIKQVKTSCGCTTAKVSKEPFGPGESIEVAVRLKTRTKPGSRPKKSVRFVLEGDYEPVILLVTAEITEFITIEPTRLERPLVQDKVISVRSADHQPFRILDVQPPVVVDVPTRTAKAVHELTILADLWEQQGRPDSLTLSVDHPGTAQAELRIIRPRRSRSDTSAPQTKRTTLTKIPTAKRLPSRPVLQTYPRRINFGHLSPGENLACEILLRDVRAVKGVKPLIASDSPLVDVELVSWQETGEGLQLKIRLIPVSGKRGRVNSLLTIDYGSGRGFVGIRGRTRPSSDDAASRTSTDSTETDHALKKGE